MARTSDPHSATAQFFINVADNGFLNHTAPRMQGWGYAVFGKVVRAPTWSTRSRRAHRPQGLSMTTCPTTTW
jgi:cyclophilin family peptidyl-prolyl cis-trans isomerase